MDYTKASEKDGTKWSLSEFITLHGNFNILQEYSTHLWCGRFNNRGIWVHVHIEKKVQGTTITDILNNQEDYEIIVVVDEYCLYKKNHSIDFSAIWEDSHSNEINIIHFDANDYYCENSDIFDGEVL